MPLRWRGPEVAARVTKAAIWGVDKTLADCVPYAKRNHPWKNVTGTAEGSIRVVQPATPEGLGVVVGRWGSVTVNYFIFLELGTSRMPARPILRPTADVMYPRLRAYIREAWVTGQ
jgi:HK97 gp10 family phage protein